MIVRKQYVAEVVLTTLGQFSLTLDGQTIGSIPASFYRMAVYLLASSPVHSASREKLGELFWPEAGSQQAHSNLRQCLARIRRLQQSCGFHLIHSNFSQVFLTPHAVSWDFQEFLEAAERQEDDAIVAMSRHYGGVLLADISEGSYVFEDWLANQRENLRAQLFARADAYFCRDISFVDDRRVACAMRILDIGVSCEPAFRILMQDAANKGNLTRLNDLYERCTRDLRDDQGVAVSRMTQDLYHRLASQLRQTHESTAVFMPLQMRLE